MLIAIGRIPQDQDLAARNAERIEAARKALGKNWIAHSAHRVLHKDGRQRSVTKIRRAA